MNITIQIIADTKDTADLSVSERFLTFGKTFIIQKSEELLLLVGMKKENVEVEDIRFIGGTVQKAVPDFEINVIQMSFNRLVAQCIGISEEDVVTAFLEGWYLSQYRFTQYKKEDTKKQINLHLDENYQKYADTARTRSNAVNIARDLCNEPANKLTPAIYAERLVELFQNTDVEIEVIDSEDLIERGFEAVATVGKGSTNSPRLVVLSLNKAAKKHVALVGKGVTFDSGGINAKTGRDIGEMKMDMGGSAAVVGAMKLLADTDSDVHVTAILPLVENVTGGNAFLPSDVITYRNGFTVEVGNTDAEGRLVLADGILYAQSLGAETIIDIATLTGAIGTALGLKVAGIFSNTENELLNYKLIGERTGDYVWPMPVIDDYQYYLESDSADINNMSSSPFGGAVTAALFLKNFIEDGKKWVHIDMANTVRPWKVQGYYLPGASGFGVRLLTELVYNEVR